MTLARCRRWAGRRQGSLVSPMVLRPRKCLVGCVEQGINIVSAGRKGGNADRDCGIRRVTIGWLILRDGAADVLGNVKCTSSGCTGQDGDDSVIVEPGDDVAGADQRASDFAHMPDQAIFVDRSPRTRGKAVHDAVALDSVQRGARRSRKSHRELGLLIDGKMRSGRRCGRLEWSIHQPNAASHHSGAILHELPGIPSRMRQ
jgi:hypothetical protein